jgi:hypothetical protein
MSRLDPVSGQYGGYLARVAFESASDEVIALCILAQQPQDSLLREIGAVFASLFGRDQHLDILFVDPDQERELARVCVPFFGAAA